MKKKGMVLYEVRVGYGVALWKAIRGRWGVFRSHIFYFLLWAMERG